MNFTYEELVATFTNHSANSNDRADIAFSTILDIYRGELKQVLEACENMEDFLSFLTKETVIPRLDPLVWYLAESSELFKEVWIHLDKK